jgi:hypothetical protein
MTQPSFVPITEADQVRPARQLKVPGPWTTARPAELTIPSRPIGPGMGTPGPDQGFALQLAQRFVDRLVLAEGESEEDVLVGCALIACRRAALYGRAPCVHDLTAAFSLWGFLVPELPELAEARREAFRGAAHDYDVQRALVDRAPAEALRLSAEELVNQSLDGWRVLLATAAGGQGAVTPVG